VKVSFRVGEQVHTVDLIKTPLGYLANLAGRDYDVQVLRAGPGYFHLRVAGQPVSIYWAVDGSRRWVAVGGEVFELDKRTSLARRKPGEVGAENILRAPMPGQVRAVEAAAGDHVEEGQTLLLLEAMKMEIRIKAPYSGQVARVAVNMGDTVAHGQILLELS
jgi:acetyl/propionyl-CoA carboxylase alpha subunit